MQFNLIDEQWIPVKRRDGSSEMIAPHEITKDFIENPVLSLDAPRPDFNGALIQFLIGLIQTVAAPINGKTWRTRLVEPPSPDELREKFITVRHVFELGGEGSRFLQDFEAIPSSENAIDGILIETPGQNALVNNTDHFIKRHSVGGICPSCCATALFTFQTNSPSGGPGYMTSLRGGGPLTTLVVGDEQHNSLWQLVWLNVLEEGNFIASTGNPKLTEDKFKFPWLAPTKKGKRKKGDTFYGEDTQPVHAHPTALFWAMPRRIKLNCEVLGAGSCGTCGKDSVSLILSYKELPGGASYTGWLHPLSPYYEQTTKGVTSILPVHAQPSGISYRHWLGLVVQDDSQKKMPARIIHDFYDRWKSGWQFRLWAFGYDMDNMKARCWYESTMPLLCIDSTIRAEYEGLIGGLIRTAVKIAGNTRSALKKAWFKRSGDVKGDTSFVDRSFWQESETDFYKTIQKIQFSLESGKDTMEVNQQWLATLCNHSLQLFDCYAWEGPIEDADPKRVVVARKELQQFNRDKKIKVLLGIWVEKTGDRQEAKTAKAMQQNELTT